jgi:hypothetical protein
MRDIFRLSKDQHYLRVSRMDLAGQPHFTIEDDSGVAVGLTPDNQILFVSIFEIEETRPTVAQAFEAWVADKEDLAKFYDVLTTVYDSGRELLSKHVPPERPRTLREVSRGAESLVAVAG